ncbi:MAG: SPOR domain-containing protein [Pseudomonadota bacterium]
MQKRSGILVSVVLAGVLALSTAHADFEAGMRAYDAGDYAAAIAEWQPLAEQGNLEAQFGMGIIYENGRGIGRDYTEAAKWYAAAAEGGHPGAQFNLGNIYQQGLGVPKDASRAVYWWTLSAAQGLSDAQLNLGIAYHRGDGVARDQDLAFSWFQRAAEAGNPMGQFSAGYAYETGLGTDVDLNEARRLYAAAAEAGIQQAANRLAELGPPDETAAADLVPETVETTETTDTTETAEIILEDAPSEDIIETETAEVTVVETAESVPEPSFGDGGTEVTSENTAIDYSDVETTETTETVETAAVETETTTAPAQGGGPYIQIAAYLSEDRAEAAWQDMTGRFPDLLGGLPHRVLMVDLGGETGTVYRLQAGPMPAQSEAQAICNELKARSADCFLVGP